MTTDEHNLQVHLQKSLDYCSNYLWQSRSFLYGLTFSHHANRFLRRQNVFFVDWRGVLSPLVTRYRLCAVFVCVTSLPRLQPINGNRNKNSAAFKTFQKDFWNFFCGMVVQSNAHLLIHKAEEERSGFSYFWTKWFFEKRWQVGHLYCPSAHMTSFCAWSSSLLPLCRNFSLFSQGFWLTNVRRCGHGWLFLKTCWRTFN